MKKEGTTSAAADFAVLEEDAPDDVELELDVEFVDSSVPEPNGLMVTVELFTHWSEGNKVALAVKVISAHYFRSR